MTTANKVTILRVILIPVFLILMLVSFPGHKWWALGLFIAASLTDSVDGYIARNYNQVSTFGKFMDPLADKLLVTAALLIFVQWGQIPGWAAFVILARELAVSGLRMLAASEGAVIAAGMSGKVKTFVTLVVFCFMMSPWHDLPLLGPVTIDSAGTVIVLIVTVWSGVDYFIRHGKLLKLK